MELKEVLSKWVDEAKAVLLQLGIHIRNMVREAQTLANAASKSREILQSLADNTQSVSSAVDELEALLKGNEQAMEVMQRLKFLTQDTHQYSKTALQAQDDVFRAAHDMSDFITKTTETLLNEAKMIQTLKTQTLSPESEMPQ